MLPRAHDLGGRPGMGPVPRNEHQLDDWEILADAVSQVLGAKGLRTTDANRRVREDTLDGPLYAELKYYEKWVVGNEVWLCEQGILTKEEIDRKVAELE